MKDHLGRNPFKSAAQQSSSPIPTPVTQKPKTQLKDFLFVDLPAGVILLSLKTALLAKAVLFDSSKKS